MRKCLLIGLVIFFASICAFGQDEVKNTCPSISLSGPAGIVSPGEELKINALLSSNDAPNLAYHWTTDKGEITYGQKTSSITVETKGIKEAYGPTAAEVSVSLEVDGLPEGCQTRTVAKYYVSTGNYDVFPVDQYGRARFGDEKARLDNLATQVLASQKEVGYIIKGFKTGTTENDIQNKIRAIKHFLFDVRKYPKNRFVIMIDPESEETKLWLWLPGETFPCKKCKVY